MTIDERLDALTQSLELMAAVQRDSESRGEAQKVEQDARMAKLTGNVNQMSQCK